jgi:CRISPR-associated protein Cas5h
MKILKFSIEGRYGHFKIPYTNNNPLSHSMLTKTALFGMMGAVVGIERSDMKRLYPVLSETLKYSVKLDAPLKKESVSFYMKNLGNFSKPDRPNKSPKPMEVIKNPKYMVYLVVVKDNEEVNSIIEKFIHYVENNSPTWKPTLGIKQCECVIDNISVSDTDTYDSEFETQTFVSKLLSNHDSLIYTDNVPTHQDNDWFNDPSLYVDIKFSDSGEYLKSKGIHYKFENESIFAI